MYMNQTASKVFNVPQPPSDTVSKIAWFPSSNNSQTFMAAASWDKTLRLWDVRNQNSTNVQIEARTMFTLDAPILSCCFSRVRFNNSMIILIKIKFHVSFFLFFLFKKNKSKMLYSVPDVIIWSKLIILLQANLKLLEKYVIYF
jgi:WD40 repeat protein